MGDLVDQFFAQASQTAARPVAPAITPERLDESLKTQGDYVPTTLGGVFRQGVEAGGRGLRADARYFQGLMQTVVGDQEGAEQSIRNARLLETQTAGLFDGIETFAEFLEEPTLMGFATQVMKGTGQILPSAASSIASGGTGALVGVLGKAAITKTGRAATKKLIQDGLIKTMRNTATPDERELANGVYSLFRNRAANAGFITGAGLSEFVPLSGQNLSEALETGQELNPVTAWRAAAIGVPQAAVGVGGEIGIAKLLGRVATQRGKAESSGILAKLGKDIGGAYLKSGAIEGTTEVIQEGMAVANRFSLDPEYDRQDANLRLGEAAFVGFFGGGTLGGAGAAPLSVANSVFRGAEKLINQGRDSQVAGLIEQEQAGAVDLGLTTPESTQDIAAQFNAMEDPNNTKQAVWVSSNEDTYNVGDGNNGVTTVSQEPDGSIVVDPDGDTYAVFIPGRGTLMSKNVSLISEVINDGASERSLAKALGYSATTPATADQVIQVTDSEGNVVHEEATDTVGLDRAIEVAKSVVPAGGKWEVVDLQSALERRKQRFEAEDDVVVRDMQVDDGFQYEESVQADEAIDQTETPNENASGVAEFGTLTEAEAADITEAVVNARLARGQQGTVEYKPRGQNVPEQETATNRAAYEEAFNITDPLIWSDEKLGTAPNSILRQATALQNRAPDIDVDVVRNDNGTWSLDITTNPDTQLYGNEQLPLALYVDLEIANAKNSKPQFKRAQLVDQEGTREDVNLHSLVQAGKRINETEGGTLFDQSGVVPSVQAGLSTIMGQLLERGLSLEIDLLPIDHPSVDTEVLVDARENVTLGQALQGRNTIPRGTYSYQAVVQTQQGEQVIGSITIDPKNMDIRQIEKKQAAFRKEMAEKSRGPVEFKRDRSFRVSPTTKVQRVNRSDLTSDQKTLLQELQNIGDRLFKGKGEPISETLRQRLFTAYTNDTRFQGSFEQWYSDKIPTWIQSRDSFEAIRDESQEQFAETPSRSPQESAPIFGAKQAQEFEIGEDGQPIGIATPGVAGQGAPNPAAQALPEVEVERIAVEALRQTDLPLTELNIEQGKPDETFKSGSAKKPTVNRPGTGRERIADPTGRTGQAPGKVSFFGMREGSAFAGVFNKALGLLKLKLPVTVMTKAYWDSLSSIQKEQFFDAEGLNTGLAKPHMAVDVVIKNMLSKNAGKYVGFRNHHIIVVNDAVGNELAQTITALHELGHALFREEQVGSLDNSGLRQRLMKGFLKAKNKADAPAQYQDPKTGFEEWYADQIAIWGLKLIGGAAAAKPRNQVEAYFKRIAMKLRQMWNSLRSDLQRRFSPAENFDAGFDTYIQEVVARNKENNEAQPSNWKEKLVVRELDLEIKKQAARAKNGIKGLNTDALKKGLNLILPADNIMRMLGRAGSQARKAAIDIANMMYSRSGEKGLGFLQLSTLQKNEFMNQLETLLGSDLYSPENQAAFEEAMDDTIPTEPKGSGRVLSPKAKQIRLFLERMHDEYISKLPDNKINKLKDYFPVRLDLLAIDSNRKAFAQILHKNQNPNAPQQSLQEMEALVDSLFDEGRGIGQEVERIINRMMGQPDDDFNAAVDPYDDNVKANLRQARKLTAGIPRIELFNAGFLKSPQEALANYVRDTVKYVEWQRAIKDEQGNDKLAAALEVLEKTNPELRQKAEEILDVYLGYQKAPLSPLMQQANSWLGFLQIITTLAFAAISSFSELAGPIIYSREFGSLRPVAWEAMKRTLNRAESIELSRQLGLVTSQSMAHAIVDPASQEYMGAKQRRWTDKWFYVTGLEWFTRFSREFGANMSREFLLHHAKNPSPDSARFLEELDITADEIKQWNGTEFTSPVGLKVKKAMQKFAESSVIRPNAAERPIWASDPRFMLIFQLKGFAYSYGKVIVGGILREIKKRKASGQYTTEQERTLAMVSMLALAGFAAMPFTMLGLELKEFTKFSLATILPGVEASDRYFRSDSMDWGSYMFEITDRSGLLGPWSLVLGAQTSADYGGSAIGSFLGPTVESMEKLFSDGLNAIPDRLIPVYSQI